MLRPRFAAPVVAGNTETSQIVTNALFASGGVSEIGSLRNIQVKRRGSLVATLDLYDLLLRGDTRNDVRLQSGDVIFIPPVGKTVGVTGEIRRPAIYEFTGEATAADLLYLAGGLLPEADPRAATIERLLKLVQCRFAVTLQHCQVQIEHRVQFGIQRRIRRFDGSVGEKCDECLNVVRVVGGVP